MYTNDEFMEHLEDANWHSERSQLLDANLTNKELEYIKNRTKVSAWGVDNLTGKEQVDKLIKEAKSQSNTMNDTLRRKAYEKYMKEHPNSKKTFSDFMK
jgi:5-bromo-4-chloroindolyl phosphate hydrolysis protein